MSFPTEETSLVDTLETPSSAAEKLPNINVVSVDSWLVCMYTINTPAEGSIDHKQ